MTSPPDCTFLGASASFRDWRTLAARGVELKWVSIRDVIKRIHVTFLDGKTRVDFGPGTNIFTDRSSVWYNPGSFEMLEDELLEIAEADSLTSFEARQFRAVLEYLEFWLPRNCHLIQSPQTQRCLSNKPIQLQVIAKVLPSSLIDTQLVSAPDQLMPGILVKHLGESRRMSYDEAFYAQELNSDQLSDLGEGPWAPMLAQRPINATEEFRTFAFGKETATIRIPRPPALGRIHDIQFFPDYVAKAFPVSQVVTDGLWSNLGASIGLPIFAVDYVMQGATPKIFEINPAFSWAWLPNVCIDAIAEAARAYFVKSS